MIAAQRAVPWLRLVLTLIAANTRLPTTELTGDQINFQKLRHRGSDHFPGWYRQLARCLDILAQGWRLGLISCVNRRLMLGGPPWLSAARVPLFCPARCFQWGRLQHYSQAPSIHTPEGSPLHALLLPASECRGASFAGRYHADCVLTRGERCARRRRAGADKPAAPDACDGARLLSLHKRVGECPI